MIRHVIAATVVAAALLASASAAVPPNVQPGPAEIKVTTRLVSTKVVGDTTIRIYDLLNRPSFTKPIGSAVLTCTKYAGSVLACHEYLRLQRGQIVTEGLIATVGFYRLAVTGGTGYYDNVGGTMTVQPLGAGVQQIVVDLGAF